MRQMPAATPRARSDRRGLPHANRMDDRLSHASHTLNPQPSAADRFYFNACRTAVGIAVLGFTLINAVVCLQPLLVQGTQPAMPSAPPTPSAPFAWWSDEDSEAARMILLISGCQAVFLVIGLGCCRMHRKQKEEMAAAAAARRATRRKSERKAAKRQARLLDATQDAALEQPLDDEPPPCTASKE